MNLQRQKLHKRSIRRKRVRSRVSGTKDRPRLSVFKANVHIYAQLIDDVAGKTLASASSREVSAKGGSASHSGSETLQGRMTGGKGKKSELAKEVGKLVAHKALAKKIKSVKFDRGGFAYHGRIKALAEGAREGGLEF